MNTDEYIEKTCELFSNLNIENIKMREIKHRISNINSEIIAINIEYAKHIFNESYSKYKGNKVLIKYKIYDIIKEMTGYIDSVRIYETKNKYMDYLYSSGCAKKLNPEKLKFIIYKEKKDGSQSRVEFPEVDTPDVSSIISIDVIE